MCTRGPQGVNYCGYLHVLKVSQLYIRKVAICDVISSLFLLLPLWFIGL